MTQGWSTRLWDGAEHVYRAILEHPFLTGLTDGTLPPERFAYYVAQDAHYLREYARALAAVGVRAPTHGETALWADHAAGTARVEIALHETLLPSFGLDPAELASVPMSPTTTAYTNYLINVATTGSYADAVAAVLPCFWIYQRVGEALLGRGSPDARYQKWIDTYGGESFAASVAGVVAMTDEVGAGLTDAQAQRAAGHYLAASRYEWMFWDAAWREEAWPI